MTSRTLSPSSPRRISRARPTARRRRTRTQNGNAYEKLASMDDDLEEGEIEDLDDGDGESRRAMDL